MMKYRWSVQINDRDDLSEVVVIPGMVEKRPGVAFSAAVGEDERIVEWATYFPLLFHMPEEKCNQLSLVPERFILTLREQSIVSRSLVATWAFNDAKIQIRLPMLHDFLTLLIEFQSRRL